MSSPRYCNGVPRLLRASLVTLFTATRLPCSAVANFLCESDNHSMPESSEPHDEREQTSSSLPFAPGSMVVVTLGNPRDKFWGRILALASEGLSINGIELTSFEDLVVMVKDGEPFTAAVVFFPMHRIERIELDLPDGSLPSLSQRFASKTGLDPTSVLRPRMDGAGGPPSPTRIHAPEDQA
jgi:hypothetical protein